MAVLAVGVLGAGLERAVLRRALGQPHLVAVLLTFGLGMMMRGGVASVPAAAQDMHRLPFAADTLGDRAAGARHQPPVGDRSPPCCSPACSPPSSATPAPGSRCARAPEDARSAALMGIPVARMHTLAWALGAALAAIAGLLLAPVTFVHLNMGFIALKAFPAAVLGGLTSLPGALVAGVFLGVAEALAGLALPEGAKDFVPYVLLMAALLLFPQGLGGGRGRA